MRDLVRLLQGGFPEEAILQAIKVSDPQFDTSPGALQALKDAGISARSIRAIESAMRAKKGSASDPTGLPDVPGVYVRQGDRYVELQGETVEWPWSSRRTEMGNTTLTHRLATAQGSHSRTQLSPPYELLLVVPEGVSASDYGLFRAEDEKGRDRRRFRIEVILWPGNSRWNEQRKSFVEFGVERVVARRYKIRLSPLDPGEYAFVAPGQIDQPTGLLYTFGIR